MEKHLLQSLMELDTRTAPEEESVYIFSGFLRCGDCGQNMVKRSTTKNGKRYYYYHCSTYKNGEGCSSHLISEKMVHKVVLDAIQRQIALVVNAENIIQNSGMKNYKKTELDSLEKQLVVLHEEVEKYKDLKTRLYQDMLENIVTREEYHEYNRRFTEKLHNAEKAERELEQRKEKASAEGKREHPWIEDFKCYQNITQLDRKAVVTLIDKIIVYGKDCLEICFKYADEIQEMTEAAQNIREMEEREGRFKCGA